MKGKIVLITGANAGIGKATALGLAKKGAHVVMVCRNPEKGEAARQEIIEASGNQQVDLLIADLASQDSIRQLARKFKEKYSQLHVLVNNAGVILPSRELSPDGLEYTFALNHLGYFLLTHLLLDRLQASDSARIVNVSSAVEKQGHINFDDLMGEKDYSSLKAYGQSKLANLLFTYELDRRLTGKNITVNALHPGVVDSQFGRDFSGFFKVLMGIFKVFMISAEKGAATSIFLASSDEVEGVSGKYWVKQKPHRSQPESYDLEIAQRLWEVSEKLTHLQPEFQLS